jgi:hypothetical protein
MIVGFDGDDAGIFARQYEFAMATAVPIFSLGTLVAPAATPLHARLAKEGRLVKDGSEIAAGPWNTNIIPKLMTSAQLYDGVKWLCNSLYRPEAFEARVARLIETFGRRYQPAHALEPQSAEARAINADSANLIHRMSRMGAAERKMLANILKLFPTNPAASQHVMGALFMYYQIRYMYEAGSFWEPMLAADAGMQWQRQREVAVPA